MKVALGTFACREIEARLGVDLSAGLRAALSDFTQRIDSGRSPLSIPTVGGESVPEPVQAVDLSVDEHTWDILQREAKRQGATLSELATHSVLLYLAELDRLTPPDAAVIRA